jgi:hypothetical protein
MPWLAEGRAYRAPAVIFLVAAAPCQSHGAGENRQGGAETFHVHGVTSVC